jgi:hypothetical protein
MASCCSSRRSSGTIAGFFMETFNQRVFRELTGIASEFVQDNHSRSAGACCAGCTTRSASPRESSCGSRRAACSTSPSIFGAARRASAVVRRRTERPEQAAALDPAGLRARIPRHERERRVSLQDDRLLGTGVRAVARVERSDRGRAVAAGRRSAAVAQGSCRQAAGRLRGVRVLNAAGGRTRERSIDCRRTCRYASSPE